MDLTHRTRGALLVALTAFAVAAVTPIAASAETEPGAKRQGFRLFARSLGALTINRVFCGMNSTGEICVDSTNSSTIPGGFWPKGTANQYIFNSGLQLAGIIGADGGPWAGDTTGAFFYDPKGSTQQGDEVTPIYNATNPDDVANWPAEALVPLGDVTEQIYEPLLRGRVSASQGDVWFISWDGNPALIGGRPHPLGVMVETRGMGWNFPSGNEDIIYFVYTFYNITSLQSADYMAVRPAMQPRLLERAQEFHSRNNAAFGVTLPAAGYTIDPLYAAFARDDDVGPAATTNYSSVILPFALGHTYDRAFERFQAWTFDPAIFSAPFFAGSGFTGAKYLKSPVGPGAIQLFSNTIRQPPFPAVPDPRNTTQLFRYLSGTMSVAAGDQPCNTGDPSVTHICYINNTAPFDMRFFQSSTPLALAPGELGTIVVAYIHAAPVSVAGCLAGPCDIQPGDPTIHGDAARMAVGVNTVDSLAGYLGFTEGKLGEPIDGIVTQPEYDVVTGSLLGKALVAQAIFDGKFLLPFAPEKPEFFLVPGDNQVTVLWRPSVTEEDAPVGGDPFFTLSNDPTGALYDPNYRQQDVEGYRIYRGRLSSPTDLTMIAQFDYGDADSKGRSLFIEDFAGQINPDPLCAPETGIGLPAGPGACPVDYGPIDPVTGTFTVGVARTESVQVPLTGQITQVKLGERAKLADGTAILLVSDTALTGNRAGFPALKNTGVPFVFVDNAVRSNFRYFYAVTTFDLNSFQSGPSSLESPRITQAVVPVAPASNYENSSTVVTALFGRDVELCTGATGANPCGSLPLPTIDPTTGIFSGPMPPADGFSGQLSDFVESLIAGPGNFAARLDSVQNGNPVDQGIDNVFWFSGISGSEPPIIFSLVAGQALSGTGETFKSLTFPAVSVDNTLASNFGGSSSFKLQGQVSITMPGVYQTNGTARGAAFGDSDGGIELLGQFYDGPRWYEGDPRAGANETFPNPTGGYCPNNCDQTNFTNAGSLPGITSVYKPMHYTTQNFHYRGITWSLSGANRSADMTVFWGAGGTVDSVIDVTHNVVIPFGEQAQGNWGFVTIASQTGSGSYDADPSTLTIGDFVCIAPLNNVAVNFGGADPACAPSPAPYKLQQTASIGPMGLGIIGGGSFEDVNNYSSVNTQGFGMYMPGNFFLFETTTLPSAGTVWTLRDYVGAVTGGNGTDASGTVIDPIGPYVYTPVVRPMTAVGAQIRVVFDVINRVNQPTANDLSRVHTVPDPYYVTNQFEVSAVGKVLKFVNLPKKAIIRIYSSSGVLVDLLEHDSNQFGGTANWSVRNRNNQVVASGVYFYHIESGDQRRVGRMTVVNFAQ